MPRTEIVRSRIVGYWRAGEASEWYLWTSVNPFLHRLLLSLMPRVALCVCLLLGHLACTETTRIYEVEPVAVTDGSGTKEKPKSPGQFFNIAHANLNQTALAPNELVQKTEVYESIGDKQVAFEVLVAKMLADPEVALPSSSEMRADLPAFIAATYRRFYVREASAAEKTWWVNYLTSRPHLTPLEVYYAFATADEYFYY